MDSPELEEDILRQLRHSPLLPNSPHSPHNRPATRTGRLVSLFLSIAVIWGLVLTALPVDQAERSIFLFLNAMLVLTFLFLFEKIIQLLFRF